MKVLLFGGTSEGRRLAVWLRDEGIDHLVCVATEYGAELLPKGINFHVGRLDLDAMKTLMGQGFDCVVDATHPYASVVTETIMTACGATGTERLRLVRDGDVVGDWLTAQSTANAAQRLESMQGNVLLTTGSKELHLFARLADRGYPRVLPSVDSLQKCLQLGFPAKQVICMQGPFTREMNEATIRQYGIDILVTKATGRAGGFWEKIEAAENCSCKVLVIGRPLHESGLPLDTIKRRLSEGR